MASVRKRGDRDDPEIQKLASRFREALRDNGYDPDERGLQVRLEAELEIDQSIISRLLKGQRGLSLGMVRRIAIRLGVHPGWLAFGEPPKRLTVDVEPDAPLTRGEVVQIVERALRGESAGSGAAPDVGQGAKKDPNQSKP